MYCFVGERIAFFLFWIFSGVGREFKFEMYDRVNGDIDKVGLSNMLSATSSGCMVLTKESYFLAGFKMSGDHSRGLISFNKNNKLFNNYLVKYNK